MRLPVNLLVSIKNRGRPSHAIAEPFRLAHHLQLEDRPQLRKLRPGPLQQFIERLAVCQPCLISPANRAAWPPQCS
jgi:hypothetical protein